MLVYLKKECFTAEKFPGMPRGSLTGGKFIIANELDNLALKYGADKSPRLKHNYTPYYFDLLKDRRSTIRKVLEIGAGEGASLRMWRDFFPNALVYGADNQDNRIFKEDRIEVFKCDQSSKQDLVKLIAKTGSDIDLVIDDGSHVPEHQVFSCLNLMPLLKSEVVYIIEDVADENIINELSSYKCEMTKFGKRYDDRIIVVRNP